MDAEEAAKAFVLTALDMEKRIFKQTDVPVLEPVILAVATTKCLKAFVGPINNALPSLVASVNKKTWAKVETVMFLSSFGAATATTKVHRPVRMKA